MPNLRWFILLLGLLSGGLAHASYSFDGAPRASDEELDSMRGGFVVSWNGLEFLMPFSITGIERLTQIGNQTYINGELVSPRLNPQALTPMTQSNQISVNLQPQPPAVQVQAPVAEAPLTQAPLTQTPVTQTPATQAPVTQTSVTQTSVTQAPVSQAPVTVATGAAAGPQVTTNGSLIVIQNGTANTVVLPPNVSLDSLATFIQNSVNNQVIRNITTLNITLNAQMLAVQARLNVLNQSLNNLR